MREIYLHNIYKGGMYKTFKKDWKKRSKGSIYETEFQKLFNIIDGKKADTENSKIMLTQATLHGIATYHDDRLHKRIAWSAPSTKVFNNVISEILYKDFFLELVVLKRFINNPNSKFLFLMGNDIYKKVAKSFNNDNELNSSIYSCNIKFYDTINKDFKLTDFDEGKGSKCIIKVKHSAA